MKMYGICTPLNSCVAEEMARHSHPSVDIKVANLLRISVLQHNVKYSLRGFILLVFFLRDESRRAKFTIHCCKTVPCWSVFRPGITDVRFGLLLKKNTQTMFNSMLIENDPKHIQTCYRMHTQTALHKSIYSQYSPVSTLKNELALRLSGKWSSRSKEMQTLSKHGHNEFTPSVKYSPASIKATA